MRKKAVELSFGLLLFFIQTIQLQGLYVALKNQLIMRLFFMQGPVGCKPLRFPAPLTVHVGKGLPYGRVFRIILQQEGKGSFRQLPVTAQAGKAPPLIEGSIMRLCVRQGICIDRKRLLIFSRCLKPLTFLIGTDRFVVPPRFGLKGNLRRCTGKKKQGSSRYGKGSGRCPKKKPCQTTSARGRSVQSYAAASGRVRQYSTRNPQRAG